MPDLNTSYLTIDLAAIRDNLNVLIRKTKNVMPMVKGNAYGTNALTLAKFYESCRVPIIGVSHVPEGIFLRQEGIKIPIFVIKSAPFEAKSIAKYQLDVAVSSLEEVEALVEAASKENTTVRLHLHVNTGMNRFGVSAEEAISLAKFIQKSPGVVLEGLMTHFACAEKPKFDSFSQKQIQQFLSVLDQIEPTPHWIHIANSSAALRFDLPFCNLSRVGLALLGFGENLTLSLSLESYLTSITEAKKGESVGYNRNFRIKKERIRIGTIPLGYHDGLHRRYSNKGYVLVHGKKAPMIGQICMDFMMVDVTDIPEAKVGDAVFLFNSSLHPEKVASWAKTDVRELLSCLGPRVKRVFINTQINRKEFHETVEQRLSSSFYPIEKNSSASEHLPPS